MTIRVHHYTEPRLNHRFRITHVGDISFDAGDLDVSVDRPAGLLLGRRSDDDVLVPWDPEADDGSEILWGVLNENVLGQGEGATEHRDYTARLAEVKAALLVYPDAVDPDDMAVALKALNIIVRE
jgi:hypothetical protein